MIAVPPPAVPHLQQAASRMLERVADVRMHGSEDEYAAAMLSAARAHFALQDAMKAPTVLLARDVFVPLAEEAGQYLLDTAGEAFADGQELVRRGRELAELQATLAEAKGDEPERADDASAVPVSDPAHRAALIAASDRFLRRCAQHVAELMYRDEKARDQAEEDRAINDLLKDLDARALLRAGRPVPRDLLEELKAEVLEYAIDVENEQVDWSDLRGVEQRARRLAEIAELGTEVVA